MPEDILSKVKEVMRSGFPEGAEIEDSVLTELAQKCMSEIGPYRPYGGATSFTEIDAAKVAQEFASKIDEQSYMLRSIVDNITSKEDLDAAQKVAAIKSAASEFETRMTNLDSGSKTILQKIKNLFHKEDNIEPRFKELPSVGGFKIYKDSQGQLRWLSLSSNAFKDRDEELFTTKALEEAIEHADKEAERGPLLVYHVPSAEIGQCDFQALAGRFLVESGTFDNTPLGSKAVEYFVKSDEDFQVSIGYQFHPGDEEDGVYDWLRILERSVLPHGAAANPWTSFKVLGEKDMNEKKLTVFKDMFGDELAAKIVADAEDKTKELEATISFKESDTEFGEITDVKEEAVRPSLNHIHGTLSHTHLVTPGYKHAHDGGPEFATPAEEEEKVEDTPMVKLASFLATLSDKMDSMEEKIKELSVSEDEKISNILRPVWQPPTTVRPTEAEDNLLSDQEKAKEVLGGLEDKEEDANPASVYVKDWLRGNVRAN